MSSGITPELRWHAIGRRKELREEVHQGKQEAPLEVGGFAQPGQLDDR